MTFDLELNVISELTITGLKKLTCLTYGNTSDVYSSFLTPINRYKLDSKIASSWVSNSIVRLNTASYKNLIDVASNKFNSYVISGLGLQGLCSRKLSIVPCINEGSVFFNKYIVNLSRRNNKSLISLDTTFNTYRKLIPSNTNIDDIYTYKSSFEDIQYVRKHTRAYNYYNLELIEGDINYNSKPRINTIYLTYTVTNDIATYNNIYTASLDGYEYYHIATINKSGSMTDISSLTDDHDCLYDTDRKLIFIKLDGCIYNLSTYLTFFYKPCDTHSYTIEEDVSNSLQYVVLSDKVISYSSISIGSFTLTGTSITDIPVRILPLLEAPNNNTLNIVVTCNNTDWETVYNGSYHALNGNDCTMITVFNPIDATYTVTGSYTVSPVIVTSRTSINTVDSLAQSLKTDITPIDTNFKNGAICIVNNDSDLLNLPFDETGTKGKDAIVLSTKELNDDPVKILDTRTLVATITNTSGIPIPNANVLFQFIDSDREPTDDSNLKFVNGNNHEMLCKTNIAGKAFATLEPKAAQYGYYIQKEWCANNEIMLPFIMPVSNVDDVYLYIVLADDPVLAQANTDITLPYYDTIKKPIELYNTASDLRSYQLTGRKIAYVTTSYETVGGSPALRATFIKPASIEQRTNQIVKARHAFVSYLSTNNIPISGTNGFFDYGNYDEELVSISNYGSAVDKIGWESSWIPTSYKDINNISQAIAIDKVQVVELNIPKCTTLTFTSGIPGLNHDNVIGYFLLANSNGSSKLRAQYIDDAFYGVAAYSNTIDIETEKFYLPDSTLLLAQSGAINDHNLTFRYSDFGFYNISEYIKSPFGLNACKLICKYSNANPDVNAWPISGRCKRAHEFVGDSTIMTYLDYHIWDTEFGVHCIHTPEYDANPLNTPCPGLDATYINPFIDLAEL